MGNEFLDFVSKIGAMKSATVDDSKEQQVEKLHNLQYEIIP